MFSSTFCFNDGKNVTGNLQIGAYAILFIYKKKPLQNQFTMGLNIIWVISVTLLSLIYSLFLDISLFREDP